MYRCLELHDNFSKLGEITIPLKAQSCPATHSIVVLEKSNNPALLEIYISNTEKNQMHIEQEHNF